ncbi:MAG: DUF2905 domain-containing protein [Acidobacteriota bacterium]|nr:DUF2905 domain-containing protein [Acidobacteriota bacterium]
MGRTLILLGVILVFLGVLFTLGERLPIKLGRLPGDIVYKGKNTSFYFPWVTCLLLSAVVSGVSGVFWLFGRR